MNTPLKTEEEVLKFWEDRRIFERSVNQNKGKEPFIFFDGPPFASGTPHWGHILISQIKDTVLRYKNQRGYYVPRRWGWDCHGVPIEAMVEKQLEIKDKREIEDNLGIDKFNDACRANVFKFDQEWRKVIRRIGRWVDMDNQYRTLDNDFAESVWWGLGELWKKDLIYKAFRISLYSPSLGIPLSHTDVAMEVKYENETVKSPVVKFELIEEDNKKIVDNIKNANTKELSNQRELLKKTQRSGSEKQEEVATKINSNINKLEGINNHLSNKDTKINILAWTTTAWTLPANSGLAVGSDINYSLVKIGDDILVLATNRLEDVLKDKEYINIASLNGKDLEGLRYNKLFNHKKQGDMVHKVYCVDFATDEDGTGIVHLAPYGEDDFELIKRENLPVLITLNEQGEYLDIENQNLSELIGKRHDLVGDQILTKLENNNRLFSAEKYTHKIPIFDRDGKRVYYSPQEGWFIKETAIKERSLELNQDINWYPDHLKHGRFGKGLETAPDWSISRKRYWGNAIPIWENKDKSKHIFISSIEELSKKAINPFYQLINNKNLDPEFYSKNRTVIFSDSKSKLPLGINAAQHRSKNLYELRQQKDIDINKFSYYAQNILNEIIALFDKYNAVQMMFSTDEQRLWTTWIQSLHPNSEKRVDKLFFYKKLEKHYDELLPTGKVLPFDIHRPYIDDIVIKEDGEVFNRVPEVLDCWVESGSMPWASIHYPFENKDSFQHPADWIVEAQDQTRGWFRVLHVLSTGVFDKPAFKNISTTGLILASDGRKMSKSKKNFSPPDELLEQYGSDAIRLYLLSSPLLNAESFRFNDNDLKQVFRESTLLVSNSLSFVRSLINEVGVVQTKHTHPLNKWLDAYTKIVVYEAYQKMEEYDLTGAAKLFQPFINNLSTWYIRRSKDEILTKEDKIEFAHCLHQNLSKLAVVFASIQPFNTEKIWSAIQMNQTDESNHLIEIRKPEEPTQTDKVVAADNDKIRDIVSKIHHQRKENSHRVRQPLYTDTSKLSLTDKQKSLIIKECNLIEKSGLADDACYVQNTPFGKIKVSTIIDETLKTKGWARDLERLIQSQRKKQGFKQGDVKQLKIQTKEDKITAAKVLSELDKEKISVNISIVDELEERFEKVVVKGLGEFNINIS